MRKEILCLLVIVLGGLSTFSLAQDFEPGSQAQGYLNNKNVSVDYAIGQLYYRVPLLELNSGNYVLPLSLNYCSQRSMYDCWTLQCGGIVTRVMRGGVPDERANVGYIHSVGNAPVLATDLKSVSAHRRDGEVDIFTVSFNGNKVNFIIKKTSSGIDVEPLERTNVKIACEASSNAQNINGWIVTDENGERYIYRQPEWTRNIVKKEMVGTNNIQNESYISSWYLTKIEIPGATDIDFYYKKIDNDIVTVDQGVKDYASSSSYSEYKRIKFYYGSPMIEYPFDFAKYKMDYDRAMRDAQSAIEAERFAAHVAGVYMQDMRGIDWSFNGAYNSMTYFNIEHHLFNVMGSMGEFARVPIGSRGIVESLDKLIRDLSSYPSVTRHLERARQLVVTALTETREKRTAEDLLSTKYQITSPVLDKIVTLDKEIQFDITNGKITDIMMNDYKGDLIQKIVLSRNGNKITKIAWLDRNRKEVNNCVFSYGLGGKWWTVLTRIMLASKGSISMNYENNYCAKPDTVEGCRLKTLITCDENGGVDTVKYRYPYPGSLVYHFVRKWDSIRYPGTKDILLSEDPFYKGNVYVNSGNNGIYYHYVEEEVVGKGTNTYLYSIPKPSEENANKSYPFWLAGIPLAKASYDKNGNLVACEKSKYYTDLSVGALKHGEGFFVNGADQVKYTKTLSQVKPSEYYMDFDSLYSYYRKQPRILLYKEGYMITNEVYFDPVTLFHANIRPRTEFKSPQQAYTLVYGGKTLLKESKKYLFSGVVSSAPSIEHLTGNLPTGARLVADVEYRYDNLAVHVKPTSEIHHLTNGDQQVVARRTPLDFSTGVAGWIDEMRGLNVVDLPVREQVLLRKAGASVYRLLTENVTTFGKKVVEGDRVVFVSEKSSEYSGTGEQQIALALPGTDTKLFTCAVGDYRESTYSYAQMNREYLPVQVKTPSTRTAYCYDQGRNNLILIVDDVAKSNTDAVDRYRVSFLKTGQEIEDPRVAGVDLPTSLEVTPVESVNKFRVFMMIKPLASSINISYSVQHGGGTVNLTSGSRGVTTGEWQLLSFDINVASYSSVSKINVSMPRTGEVACGVIVPWNATFEATSFDPFGQIFCKFNQLGQVERYEYDDAGRLSKKYDRDGNILEVYNYETLL